MHQAAIPADRATPVTADPRCFTGRAAELEQALAASSYHGGPALIVVTGSGGSGQTALALAEIIQQD